MYPSKEAHELGILLRISRDLDIIGDITATVDNPSELLAWARILDRPSIAAWTSRDSGARYVQVSANHHRSPIHGWVSALLPCAQHPAFWRELVSPDLEPGAHRSVTLSELARAWEAMPIHVPDDPGAGGPRPPQSDLSQPSIDAPG